MAKQKEELKGDCEFCQRTDLKLVNRQNGLMCEFCVADEDSVPVKSAADMIVETRTIDSTIQIKTDVFLAKSVAAIELKRAIDADDTIASDQKDYTMARESLTRYKAMKKAIFDERQAFLASIAEKENEARMWQTQVQEFAGKVSAEKRREFQKFDVDYQPDTPKSVKSPRPAGGSKKYDRDAVNAAAQKYGVPAAAIQFQVRAMNMSPELAAVKIAKSMGLLNNTEN